MLIIGVAGKKRAGKNTVAQMVVEHPANPADGKIEVIGFADLLKISAMRALGVPRNTLVPADFVAFVERHKDSPHEFIEVSLRDPSGHVFSYRTLTMRQYLQFYGTEAHREVFGDEFWIKALLDAPWVDDCDLLVIPDVRFDNEAQAIKDRGGVMWEVIRDLEDVVDGHASEAGLSSDLIDRVIDNQGTFDDLRGHVDQALKSLSRDLARS